MNEKFDNIIRQRIYQRVPIEQIRAAGIGSFYVAGNSLNKQPPNDIDIFPVDSYFTREQSQKLGGIVSETKNATTIKVPFNNTLHHQTVDGSNEIEVAGKTVTVQLCNYHHENLEKLVNSFDFSHIQIGALVDLNQQGSSVNIVVYYTKAYEDAKMMQSTEYVGSEYPLSSLIRAFKYAKRGDFAGNSHIFSVFKVLTDVIHRGFDDFDDFKNQLDAIDLGLVPENPRELHDAGLSDAKLDFSQEGMEVLNKLMNFLILGKKAICKDAESAYKYAEALGERFEEGENIISKNAEYSFSYAKNVLRGRFEKGENAMIESEGRSNICRNYASVTKTRFEKYEEFLAKENNAQQIWFYWNSISSFEESLPETLHNIMIAYAMDNDYNSKRYIREVEHKKFIKDRAA